MKDIVEEIRVIVESYKTEYSSLKKDRGLSGYSSRDFELENTIREECLRDFIDTLEETLSYYE